jgi:hypothetical protein
MNREDIIRIYKEANGWSPEGFENTVGELERFAALVRADEREACAKVCESEAEMFKSCAYGANDGRYDWKEDGARECAAAIRARGQA